MPRDIAYDTGVFLDGMSSLLAIDFLLDKEINDLEKLWNASGL